MVELPETDSTGNPGCACRLSGCFYSIRTHLIILLTVVVTVVYGVVAFSEISDELHRTNNDLHRQVKQLSDVQAEALSVPLWNFDRAEVKRQLNVLVVNRDIVKADVLEADGHVFAQARDKNALLSPGTKTHHHDHSDPDVISQESSTIDFMLGRQGQELHLIESDIRNDNLEVIGTLQVAMTHEHLFGVQQNMLWSHLKQFLVITLVVAFTIGAAVTGLVRPVLDITEAMDKVAAGDVSVAIPATDRRDEIGKMARALEVFKSNAEQLQVALNNERELNGLQRQFVSMVSHEFRTPLSVIDGNAQRLLRRMGKMSPDRMTDSLIKVRHSVAGLTELMESVLNAARLEEGRISFEPMACSLPDILIELANSYADIYEARSIVFDIEELPPEVMADRKLLRQVFSNLLSNACKYSGPNSNIRIMGRSEGESGVVVSVHDEGVGIPPDELQQLFNRFFRASTSTGIAGTGIGLHLVHHFVGLHGGHVDVSSTVGEGTVFSVHLPRNAPNPEMFDQAA